MYAKVDIKNHAVEVYKDLKSAAESIGSQYKTVKRHLDKKGFYQKQYHFITDTEIIRSNRGNPNLISRY